MPRPDEGRRSPSSRARVARAPPAPGSIGHRHVIRNVERRLSMNRSDHRGMGRWAAALLLTLSLSPAAYAGSVFYRVHKLVADQSGDEDVHVDPDLVNPWGIAFNPFGVVWVADNGTG